MLSQSNTFLNLQKAQTEIPTGISKTCANVNFGQAASTKVLQTLPWPGRVTDGKRGMWGGKKRGHHSANGRESCGQRINFLMQTMGRVGNASARLEQSRENARIDDEKRRVRSYGNMEVQLGRSFMGFPGRKPPGEDRYKRLRPSNKTPCRHAARRGHTIDLFLKFARTEVQRFRRGNCFLERAVRSSIQKANVNKSEVRPLGVMKEIKTTTRRGKIGRIQNTTKIQERTERWMGEQSGRKQA